MTKLRRAVSGWWDDLISIPWSNYPGQVLLRMPISPGSWVINAKAVLVAHVDTHGVAGCRIVAGADTDRAQVHFIDPDDNSAPLRNFNGHSVSLQVVHTFTSHSSVIFQCWGQTKKSDFHTYEDGDKVRHTGAKISVTAENIKITAVEVDQLTNAPLKRVQ
ncbi:MAG: hypothetical protein AAF721_17395 [Myxococcota bacterium]